jgi:carboxymethylenebutenolidase
MNSAIIRTILMLSTVGVASAQDASLARLEKSPRHQEWVKIKHGDRTVQAFVVYPKSSDKTPVVLLIHENMGLTDWVRSMADQLAEAGYIAIAPDLLSGYGPNGGKTSDFPPNGARDAIYKLTPDGVTADLNAVADYALKIPSANGKLAVAGFCWGGGESFRFATNRPDLKAAFVFYGPAPVLPDDLERIKAPVYGFYGGNDTRIGARLPKTVDMMATAEKKFEPVTYALADHAFMRIGEDPAADEANRKAHDAAWIRWKSLLEKM